MSERITAVVKSNGSLTYTTPLKDFYQGSAYDLYLDIQFEQKLEDGSAVQIMFRRSDGKQTSWILMNTVDFETYTIKLDDGWYWNKEGDLTFTVQAYKKINNVLTILASSYSSFYVNPTPAFYEPSPLAPNAYQSITTDLQELKNDVLDLMSEGLVTAIEGDIEAEGTEYAKIKYIKTNDIEEEVRIKMPSGLATKSDVDAKIEETNPVKSIVSTNDDLQFKYKNVSGETTVTLKSNGIVKKTELEDFASDLVSFSHTGAIEEIENQVYFARRAEADAEGNIINETYVNNNTEEDIHKRGFYSSNDTSSVGFTDEEGAIKFISSDTESKTGTLTVKPTTGEFSLTGEVEATGTIQDIALNNKINTFSQPQVFTERIDIKNSDGTVDSIKHINNNFLISASSGENLLNLDEQLNKGYIFNEEIALQSKIDEINNKPVYAIVYIYGFPFGANCVIGEENTCLVVDDDTGHAYACGIFISRNNGNLNPILRYFIPIGNSPVVENPQLEILSVVKVGDL